MVDVALKCKCGELRGTVTNVSPETGNRLICYCNDCQAFARYLDQESAILDEHGGTDIYQTVPAAVNISAGSDQLRCKRLTENGLFRWYTQCCKTPVGNTVSAGLPFAGLFHNIMDDDGARDQNMGPVRYYVQGKTAKGKPPADKVHAGFPFAMLARSLPMLLIAKLRGQHKPSPFFDDKGQPIISPDG